MKSSWNVLAISILVLTGLHPVDVRAQDQTREPVPHENLISGSPFALVAGAFNAEYEKKLNSTMTTGIAAGWVDFDHQDFTGVAGFLRFYPQQTALTGFYIGGHSGLYRKEHKSEGVDESESGLGIGLDVGYGWLFGPSRTFFVGLGAGVTRLIAGASGSFPVGSILNIGIAF